MGNLLDCTFFIVALLACLGTRAGEYGMGDAVVTGLCYWFVFEINSFIHMDMFVKDERVLWKNFTLVTPNGIEKQIKSKYAVILISMIFIASVSYMTDIICMAVCKEQAISMATVISVVFYIKMFMTAIEVPFLIRYGSAMGEKVKWILVGCVIGVLALYALFGNISMFLRKDFLQGLMDFVKQAGVIWFMAVLPYVAIGSYLLSYKISLKCYRKEMDFDD